ncbi:hypothetical protein SANTM175S_04034 [Streptomyces antimycoticus]
MRPPTNTRHFGIICWRSSIRALMMSTTLVPPDLALIDAA